MQQPFSAEELLAYGNSMMTKWQKSYWYSSQQTQQPWVRAWNYLDSLEPLIFAETPTLEFYCYLLIYVLLKIRCYKKGFVEGEKGVAFPWASRENPLYLSDLFMTAKEEWPSEKEVWEKRKMSNFSKTSGREMEAWRWQKDEEPNHKHHHYGPTHKVMNVGWNVCSVQEDFAYIIL